MKPLKCTINVIHLFDDMNITFLILVYKQLVLIIWLITKNYVCRDKETHEPKTDLMLKTAMFDVTALSEIADAKNSIIGV